MSGSVRAEEHHRDRREKEVQKGEAGTDLKLSARSIMCRIYLFCSGSPSHRCVFIDGSRTQSAGSIDCVMGPQC